MRFNIKQKLIGALITLLGILSIVVGGPTGDGTAGIVLIPLGCWILLSKKKLVY